MLPIPIQIFSQILKLKFSHFFTFIELILRTTLTIDQRNTKGLYKLTTSLLTISSQMLLASNYQCLAEIRANIHGNILDRVISIMVPIGLISAGTLLSIAGNLSFNPERHQLSFLLRQITKNMQRTENLELIRFYS